MSLLDVFPTIRRFVPSAEEGLLGGTGIDFDLTDSASADKGIPDGLIDDVPSTIRTWTPSADPGHFSSLLDGITRSYLGGGGGRVVAKEKEPSPVARPTEFTEPSFAELSSRAAQGLMGVANGLVREPALQTKDMLLGGLAAAYNEGPRKWLWGESEPRWFPQMDSDMSRAYDNGVSRQELMLRANPLTSMPLALYDTATALKDGRWGDAAESGAGLAAGWALGKYGGHGIDLGTATPGTLSANPAWWRPYQRNFYNENPGLVGLVVIHHAIEQNIMKKYPDMFTPEEMHSVDNLRGIPIELNGSLHQSTIRKEWNQFHRDNPKATKQQILDKVKDIDKKYGYQFNPPLDTEV